MDNYTDPSLRSSLVGFYEGIVESSLNRMVEHHRGLYGLLLDQVELLGIELDKDPLATKTCDEIESREYFKYFDVIDEMRNIFFRIEEVARNFNRHRDSVKDTYLASQKSMNLEDHQWWFDSVRKPDTNA